MDRGVDQPEILRVNFLMGIFGGEILGGPEFLRGPFLLDRDRTIENSTPKFGGQKVETFPELSTPSSGSRFATPPIPETCS